MGSPAVVTVACSRGRLLVGFTAARSTMGMPLEMPPSMPPWRLVPVTMREPADEAPPSGGRNRSLFSLPRSLAQPNPTPYSTPSTAGRLNRAFARSAFSLSKTGSPRPAGTPTATISATPPMESRASRNFSISATISAARGASGHRTMFGAPSGSFSTCSTVTAAGSGTSATTSPTWRT